MNRTKRTEVKTETHEVWIVHRHPPEAAADELCGECFEPSPLINMTDACSQSGMTTAAVCALVAGGAIHSLMAPEGHLLICINSLRRSERGELIS